MKGQKTIMKLNVFNRKKTALEKLTSTYDVKLDASASQLIMDVLAKLYDNPVEAAIREYVSNAYDANLSAKSAVLQTASMTGTNLTTKTLLQGRIIITLINTVVA
jgi:hypothetical protein